jgi:SulP family sulfate permease
MIPLFAPTSPNVIRDTLPVALAVTLLALTEAVSIARAVAIKSGQRIDANQEFIGQGLSNICGSFFSAYASSGSFNRSGANYEAGARTPLAAVFAALFLIAILFALGRFVAYLPLAVMAAILFLVAYGLFDLHHIRNIVRTSRRETAVMLLTFWRQSSPTWFTISPALLSLMLYLTRTAAAHPRRSRLACAAITSPPTVCPIAPAWLRVNDHLLCRCDMCQNRMIGETNPGRSVLIVASGIISSMSPG